MSARQQAISRYGELLQIASVQGTVKQATRALAAGDLFFFLWRILGRKDIDRDWLFARCREVQAAPDGYLDLWAREHYKSTIITFGLTLQQLLTNPELTVGILSYNRPSAKAFLRQIKRELESNPLLLELWPEVVWDNPHRQAPKWSEDDGIILRRKGNPKEASVEAWGLVDGQPTGRHWQILVYDDVVTRESVTTPDMIRKTTEAWELSRNLTTEDGVTRYIGTRYHYGDTYRAILDRGAAIERRHPGTADGRVEGEPVLWTREHIADKYREMGPQIFSAQILQDPRADDSIGFRGDAVKYWAAKHYDNLNIYLLCDPAHSKKDIADYTAMAVIGLGPDRNYYVIDMVRDRLTLTQRADTLISLHRKYRPIAVGYEQYGLQADIQHVEYRQGELNYRFVITPLGGRQAKADRIGRLIPIVEAGTWYLPESLPRVNQQGRAENLVQIFLHEELLAWPYCTHDDMLDCCARVLDADLGAEFPLDVESVRVPSQGRADAAYDEWA